MSRSRRRSRLPAGTRVDHRIDATLHGVGLGDELFEVRVADLSGGQKGRLALAMLLLSGNEVLLLDEPTNHLDIAGRQWLEEYLAAYRGAVILVSHDRWVLNRVVETIYELEGGKLVEYPGNYQAFRQQRAQRRLSQQRLYEKQQDKIRQEQGFIDRYRAGQRASQAQGRQQRLERFKQTELIDRPVELDELGFAFTPVARSGQMIVTAEGIGQAYDGKPLFQGLSLKISRGDRVGIIGPNGAGKSTLVRVLLGEQTPGEGSVRLGASLNMGHYHQTHESLDLSDTVVQYLQRKVSSGNEQDARNLAGAFLFSGDEQDKPLRVLSGGERSRSVLAGLVAGGHNLLVLDEPTNHLDIPSAERLEEALRSYTAGPRGFGQKTGGGTLILITHDRMLLDGLVDQLIVLDGEGHTRHVLGTYSEYLASQQTQKTAPDDQPAGKAKASPSSRAASGPKTSQTVNTKVGTGTGLERLKLGVLEQRIEEIETRIASVDSDLADPDIYRDGQKVKQLQARRAELVDELTPLEAEWSRRVDG